ncbi:methylamine utilization protein [uncultured Sphingomonas sp.]|jgi:plastocyanin|uniref:methylamine utilization protein n=1 Tax=uncultured Sphingomonas sp. TaxID=158754 RepID=UPI0035CB2ADA
MSFRFVTALFLLVQAAASHAATVSIEVRAIGGRPLPGAVVTIDSARPVPVTLSPRVTYQIEQRDIAFQPSILIVPVGATVAFPNRDKVRHHVYSFSKPKRIDLKLYGREDTRSVTFDKPGVVALGCNIHDAMSGFVYVTATPFAALTDAAGKVTIANVPAGGARVTVWHPSIRSPGGSAAQPITVGAAGFATVFALHR